MPTSVKQLFSSASLEVAGQVKWGTPITENRSGVYVVATTSEREDNTNFYGNNPPIDFDILKYWIDYVPTMQVDNKLPTPDILQKRLTQFWLPDEPILYIGQTTKKLSKRIRNYYKHKLGDPRKHRGGHWIKTLSDLDDLNVYWATTIQPKEAEDTLIQFFIDNVSKATKLLLRDPEHSFPFANLEFPKSIRKKHGLSSQTL